MIPTILLVCDDSGNLCKKVLEQEDNPLAGLSFSDFTLKKLLDSGITPKALAISPDLRLGFDDEIDSFNQRLISMRSELVES